MCACARLLLLAVLPAFAGLGGWCVDGEVVSLMEDSVGGGGPAFAPRQHTAVVAPIGHAATLDCRVLHLGDKSVLWVRSRDLKILSHAGMVFTADDRVSATRGMDGVTTRHTLRIDRLRTSDGGRYECQVNTEPKLSFFFNLTVVDEVVPAVEVSAIDPRVVNGVEGGTATLACEARYSPAPRLLPLPPLDIRWHRTDGPLTPQVSGEGGRGGVSLDTERWAARVVSRLTLAELKPRDAGAYICTAAGETVTLRLRVEQAQENPEAMQRDQAVNTAPSHRSRRAVWLWPFLWLLFWPLWPALRVQL